MLEIKGNPLKVNDAKTKTKLLTIRFN
jgi:hypothetical protein